MTSEKNIIIVGGGIIGCCTAYYLSRHHKFCPTTCNTTLIEASSQGLAQGASGKAGGLVAKWAYPKNLVDVSFREHVKLAEQHGGDTRWGWRYVNCGSWEVRGDIEAESGVGVGKGLKRKSLEKTRGLDDQRIKGIPEWVKKEATVAYSSMAPEGDTAQVHPFLFTTSMCELAQEKGVAVVKGKVTSVLTAHGRVTGVAFLKPGSEHAEELPATHVIVCAGAWSPAIVPGLPISTTRAHSITVHPNTHISAYVLFTEITLSSGLDRLEIYARPNNEIYVCGSGDDCPLPETVDDVEVDVEACKSIHIQASSISKEIRDGTLDKQQACFLPLGGPILGHASNISKGLYIAAGHTCWGICNAPGTGLAMSELIMDGKITCAPLKKLAPSRFF